MMNIYEMMEIKKKVKDMNDICKHLRFEFIYETQFYIIKITNLRTNQSKLISLDELNKLYDRVSFVKVI